MIRILHTADWHLGKKLERFHRLPEQEQVLEEICAIADKESVDVVVIAGDLYDTFNPSTEAETLFYHTLKRLSNGGRRAVVAIAGNHDSPDRIRAPEPLALENGIIMAGYPDAMFKDINLDSGLSIVRSEPGFVELSLPGKKEKLRVILAPYANEPRLKSFLGWDNPDIELRHALAKGWKELADRYCDPAGVNILIGHFFMIAAGGKNTDEPDGERPILHVGGAPMLLAEDVPQQIQYTALGHLHGLRRVVKGKAPVLYCGSPLAYSMSEAGQEKQVIIADITPGKAVKWRPVPLTAGRLLYRKTFDSVADALKWLQENPETLVELTLRTDNYISGSDRRELLQAHDGLVTIIPEFTGESQKNRAALSRSDLERSLEDLFVEFFRAENDDQEPDETLLQLLREIDGGGGE